MLTTKMNTRMILSTTILALTIGAGTTAAMASEPEHAGATKPTMNAQPNEQDKPYANRYEILHFVGSDTLIGSELRDDRGNKVGKIDDFIVDRGSGRIVYAVVGTGEFLGLGGKQVALPYDLLHYNAPNKAYSTEMNKQEIEEQTKFLPENWKDLTDTSWMDKLTAWADRDKHEEAEKATREQIRTGDRTDLNGRVTKIESYTDPNGDMTAIWVTDDNDENSEVVLGPTWYIMGTDDGITRNDEIELSVVEHDGKLYAATANINGHEIRLRDSEGQGYWDTPAQKAKRYFLLSQLHDHKVEIAGSTIGEVQHAVVEAPSGYVAMIELDPNENLFGLGDDISLIPFPAVRIGPKLDVRIIGSNEEVERSLIKPHNLDDLRTPASVAQSYNAFGLSVPNFIPRN